MIGSPKAPDFIGEAFDDSFFTKYEEQLSDISIEEQATTALAEIMTIEKADGSQKSYDELRSETQTFFTNDWVRNDEAVMNHMAIEFAHACMGHNHGADLAQDNQLRPVFETGLKNSLGNKYGHKHKKDDKGEIDPKTGKKKKKKRSWFS